MKMLFLCLCLAVGLLMSGGSANAQITSGNSPAQQQEKKCIAGGGCGGQLCVEEGMNIVSTCEWSPSYSCYQSDGICVRQPDGKCGWTQTDALKECLAKAQNNPANLAPPSQR